MTKAKRGLLWKRPSGRHQLHSERSRPLWLHQPFPRWTVGSIVKFKNGYSMRRARDRCEKGEKEEMMEAKGEQNRGLCSGDSVGSLYCIMIVVTTQREHTLTHTKISRLTDGERSV